MSAVTLITLEVSSTVQLRDAGVGSTFPTASIARTENVCGPSPTSVYRFGDVHRAKGALSRRHSKVDSDSVEEKLNWASGLLSVPTGPLSIVVSGGVVSALLRSIELCRYVR